MVDGDGGEACGSIPVEYFKEAVVRCRVHFPRIECRTDALHVAKCLFATSVRFCNWVLAASAGYAALRMALGVSASAAACARYELLPGCCNKCYLIGREEGERFCCTQGLGKAASAG